MSGQKDKKFHQWSPQGSLSASVRIGVHIYFGVDWQEGKILCPYIGRAKFKMFHRAFQSIIALLGMGKKEGKKGLKENIMTFKSKELISVKIILFDSNPVRLIITKPNIQNLVESNLFHGNAELLVF